MEHADKRFTSTEEALLERTKGALLLSIDTVLAAPPYNSWNTVRLHFDGFDLDVSSSLNDLVVDEFGTLEEFGLLSVREATDAVLEIPEVGTDTTVFRVNQTVNSVSVVNDVATIYGEGLLVAKLEYPQAIAFGVGESVILLDKGVCFSQMIAVRQGGDIENLLYDDSVNWEDDPEGNPTTHFEFRAEVQVL